jgi:hypothetical protein
VGCVCGRWAGFLPIVVMVLASIAGCERGGEASRAVLAERRASWAREIAGLNQQYASLATRLGGRLGVGTGAGDTPAERRMRATLDGTHQAIADVETQLQQAAERIEQAIGRGGQVTEKTLDEESARARGYLHGLGEQLGLAARQVDELAWNHQGETTP